MNKICPFIFLNLFIFTSGSDIIYDSAGHKLLRGIPYYILPLLRGSGGGLTLTRATKGGGCPLNVTQEPFEVNNGVPFTFKPIILTEKYIREAYPISIESDVSNNPCYASNVLKVTTAKTRKKKDSKHLVNDDQKYKVKKKKHHDDDDDDDDDKYVSIEIVTNGGEFNKPESCFQFVEDNLMPGLTSYQIQHCPFKCGSTSTSTSCYNVGIIKDVDGIGYLGHTDEFFPVVFTNSYGLFDKLDNNDMSAKLGTFSRFVAKVTTFSRSWI